MLEVHKVWLAAVIDCEGCISLGRTKRTREKWISYSGLISIVNTDKRLINQVQKILKDYKFGISYQLTSPGRFGKKPQYRIFIRGRNLKSVLQEVLPYLICKKKIAKKVMKWSDYIQFRKNFSILKRRNDRVHYDKFASSIRELMPNIKLV